MTPDSELRITRDGCQYGKAITTVDMTIGIKGVDQKTIPAGTSFYALTHLRNGHGKLEAFVSTNGYRACHGLGINLVWEDEFKFVEA